MIVFSVALVAGAQRIQFPQGGPWQQVKLANESQYDLTVQIAGVQDDLGASTANRYPVNGANFIDVTATALQPVDGAPSAALQLTLAGPGEVIVGTYPVTLVRKTTTNLAQGASSSPFVAVALAGASQVSVRDPGMFTPGCLILLKVVQSGGLSPVGSASRFKHRRASG